MQLNGIVGLCGGVLAVLLLAACGAALAPTSEAQVAAMPRTMTVYKSPSCGCCSLWIDYLEERGYTITIEDHVNMAPIKAEHNVPLPVQSCHTALVEGYVIEGHVPLQDIERLLTERPDVVGLAVPGMPIGAPGMEVDGTPPDAFDVIAFDAHGNMQVYASHPHFQR
ncbi:MAG: DUF411 domain-containing protein [Chloroflexaceae bacterium]|nr:DUF411 domain-containing protein [Chloroflexaceae bacterium]